MSMIPSRTGRQVPQATPPPPAPEEEPDLPRYIGTPSPRVPRTPSGTGPGLSRVDQYPLRDRTPDDFAYIEGDQFGPARLSPNGILNMQAALVDAGLLTGKFAAGVWDPKSQAAYKNLLELANAQGANAQTVLRQLLSSRAQIGDPFGFGSSGGSRRAPLQVRLSNPDDLKRMFRQVTYNMLGGQFLDDEVLDRYVSAVHDQERSFQQTAYNQAASGGTVTDPASPETSAEAAVQFLDPGGVTATRVAGLADVLTRMIGPMQ